SSEIQTKKYRASDRTLVNMHKQLNNGSYTKINKKVRKLLEFSRKSEESLSSQKAFINLWIALESFVNSNEDIGGLESVKNNISAADSHNYIYSIIRNLMEDLRRCNVSWKNNETSTQVKKEYEFLEYLLDDSSGLELIRKCKEKN